MKLPIRLAYGPKVYVTGRMTADDGGIAAFLADSGVERWETDASEGGSKLVEFSGRACYRSFARPRPGGHSAYVGHILEVGHGSVLEHAVIQMTFANVSRSFTHEFVRHRVGLSPSQESQRYVDAKDVAFVVPPLMRRAVRDTVAWWETLPLGALPQLDIIDQEVLLNHYAGVLGPDPTVRQVRLLCLEWLSANARALRSYALLSGGLTVLDEMGRIPAGTMRTKRVREASRSVLPNDAATVIVMTGNARAWRHFLHMRGAEAADFEMRGVATEAAPLLVKELPSIFADVDWYSAEDGFPAVKLKHGDV